MELYTETVKPSMGKARLSLDDESLEEVVSLSTPLKQQLPTSPSTTVFHNPVFGVGLEPQDCLATGEVSSNVGAVRRLLKMCPVHKETPLVEASEIASCLNIASLHIKDESNRMGMGSFKALGAAYAIAKQADAILPEGASPEQYATALEGRTFVAASAGNHGLSIAAGARVFGAKAVIYLCEQVPEDFAIRLRKFGAEVVRAGAVYQESVTAATEACADPEKNWTLLADGSWVGYQDLPTDVMEGYLVIGHEVIDEFASSGKARPTHVMLQAGVGGLAAAMAVCLRKAWPESTIVVVEPDQAPACMESVRAGRPVETHGGVSIMGRLDCKVPSHVALKCLARDANFFVTITDDQGAQAENLLTDGGFPTSSSGAAGVAALLSSEEVRREMGVDSSSRVLVFASEGK
jgi:diaminopropionate ammonia-lyase